MQIVTPTAALNDAITLLIAYSAEITTAQGNPATGHVDDADARQDIAHIGDTVARLRSLLYALADPASRSDQAVNELIAAAFRDEPATAVRVQDVIEQVLALAAPAPQPTAAMVTRLVHAIEGECDGLAISAATAEALLVYALQQPPAPQPTTPNSMFGAERPAIKVLGWPDLCEDAPALQPIAYAEFEKVQLQRNELRRALEIIAVGDAQNPQAQAADELIALGYWRDIPEARKPAPQPEPSRAQLMREAGYTRRPTLRELSSDAAAPSAKSQAGDVWLPIETAPRDGTMFLCWVEAVRYGETDEGQPYQQDASQIDFCAWRAFADAPDGGYFDPMCGQIADQQRVTHWRPLPSAPKEQA